MGKKDRNADKRILKQQRREQEARRKKRLPMIFGAVLLGVALTIGGFTLSNLYDQTQQEQMELYKNQISAEQLKQKIENKEEVYAYFYAPDCDHCQIVSPMLIPMAETMGKPLYPVNVNLHKELWQDYELKGTPTLIHFKEGKEAGTLVGQQTEDTFRDFLSK